MRHSHVHLHYLARSLLVSSLYSPGLAEGTARPGSDEVGYDTWFADLDVIHKVTGIAVSPEGQTLTPLSLSVTVVIRFRVQCADKD